MTAPAPAGPIQADIVSDVVCPWCLIGFLQLSKALQQTGLTAALRWHPFELNPQMAPEGENLRAHLMEKYGITAGQSAAARENLTALGAGLGFDFRFTGGMRMVNTFKAHQLLDWAEDQGLQTRLKQVLFKAYFNEGKNVSDGAVLVGAAAAAGLDAAAAAEVLESGARAEQVRAKQQFWQQRGITGVPAMVFGGKYLVTGAQGVEAYAQILQQVAAEQAA